MKLNLDNPLLLKIVAVIVAIGMFIFVSNENERTSLRSDSSNYSTTEILTNIAVTSNVDEETYYVSGIPDSVSLRLDGPQPVIAQTVITQNFNITTPDLNDLGPGEHRIELVAEGLSPELDYSISPSETTVRVEERQTKQFDVEVEFNEGEYIATGFEVTDIEASHNQVTISGAQSTIDEIAQVKAVIQPNSTNIQNDISTVGNLVVLNDQDEPLNVSIDPAQIDVNIQVESQQKELPISLVETGEADSGYEYNLAIAEDEPDTISVSGDYDVIKDLETFEINVDLSGITQSTTRRIPIVLPDGVTDADLDSLNVRITVKQTAD